VYFDLIIPKVNSIFARPRLL